MRRKNNSLQHHGKVSIKYRPEDFSRSSSAGIRWQYGLHLQTKTALSNT
jgi:hypothetical protein